MFILPTLFKKSNTGATLVWDIAVRDDSYAVTFGQFGGKLQTTSTTCEGKNAGKANATSASDQAVLEAIALHKKQVARKGYTEDRQKAERGETDQDGGAAVMLSPNKSYPKDGELAKRIKFPCYVQPKLDGARCVAVINSKGVTLWSRTRKRITSVPHIEKALADTFCKFFADIGGHVILDGEIYNHEYRNRFEDLMSIIRKDEPDAEGLYKDAQYHVYDLITDDVPYAQRLQDLCFLFDTNGITPTHSAGVVQLVHTYQVKSLPQLVAQYESFLDDEYEGAMARNSAGYYERGKRSTNLLKMKPFEDHEFKVIGLNEGKGKDAGTAGTLEIELPCLCCGKGNRERTGKARLKGPYERRRQILQHPETVIGKTVTVCLKRWTSDDMPYLPIAKAIRDYE